MIKHILQESEQNTPIPHAPKRQSADIANYERNPGLQYRLLIKVARGVLKNNVLEIQIKRRRCNDFFLPLNITPKKQADDHHFQAPFRVMFLFFQSPPNKGDIPLTLTAHTWKSRGLKMSFRCFKLRVGNQTPRRKDARNKGSRSYNKVFFKGKAAVNNPLKKILLHKNGFPSYK